MKEIGFKRSWIGRSEESPKTLLGRINRIRTVGIRHRARFFKKVGSSLSTRNDPRLISGINPGCSVQTPRKHCFQPVGSGMNQACSACGPRTLMP